MGRKADLTDRQVLVIRAIIERSRLYDGPRQLGYNLFGRNVQSKGKVEQAVRFGLSVIRSIFDFIDENGDFSGSVKASDEQRVLLKKIKKSFSTFQDFETAVREFVNKKEAR